MWPFTRRRETRSSSGTGSYTALLTQALVDAATGSTAANPTTTGALEVCAGMWARAFASARVTPSTATTAAVTPDVLATIGRQIVRVGEALHVIAVTGGRVRLRPIGQWDVYGKPDPETWTVDVYEQGPSLTETRRRLPYDEVLHCTYATDPWRPWAGVAPLAWASETGRLAAALERALADEAGGPVGSIVPIPEGQREPTDDDDDDDADPFEKLRADVRRLRGRLTFAETMAGGYGDKGSRPDADWKPRRIGANPPASLNEIRTASALTVFGACGVPPSLVTLPADGTGQREAWRRFLHGSVAPVARMIEVELRRKLDTPNLTLHFDDLQAADLTARARAAHVMTQAGVPLDEARRITGLA